MRKIGKKVLVLFLGIQTLFVGPIIAESVAGIGSDEISQDQSALVIDSLHTQEPPSTEAETMVASYYAHKFHGRKTANGEVFDMNAMTCAHKTLPFDTKLLVINPKNGKTVEVRVNDRGPFPKGRDIDLSYAAAKEIEMIRAGVAKVEVIIIHPENETLEDQFVQN